MSSKKNQQWFGPAKVNNMGFGIYSWQGWISILIFIILVASDVVFLSRYTALAIILAIVLIVAFFAFAIKHGATFTNNNLR